MAYSFEKPFLYYALFYLFGYFNTNYKHGQIFKKNLKLSVFKESFASIDKTLFLGRKLGTRLTSIKF